jgi:hypothetical protein
LRHIYELVRQRRVRKVSIQSVPEPDILAPVGAELVPKGRGETVELEGEVVARGLTIWLEH